MNLALYKVENYTHTLRCKHVIGKTVLYYDMKCTLINTTKSGNARVVVFGDRYWPASERKSVRYVKTHRLQKRERGKEKP